MNQEIIIIKQNRNYKMYIKKYERVTGHAFETKSLSYAGLTQDLSICAPDI